MHLRGRGRPWRGDGTRAAKLYVTPLYNFVQPLIRYEITGEVTLLPEPCPCGSPLRLIVDIGGRTDDVFHYGETSVHPLAFRSPLGRHRNVVEYQVLQTATGADIALRVIGTVNLDELRESIARELSALGLPAPQVTVRLVDGFERQRTGKLRRFVPLS